MHPSDFDLAQLQRDTAALASITPRLGGTPGEAVARDWVMAQFRAAGLQRVRAQPILYPRWSGAGRLSLDGQGLSALALHGSGSTMPAGLSAPLLDLAAGGKADYARRSRAELRGKVHLAESGVIYRRRTVLRAEKFGAAAVILVNPVGTEIEAGTAQIFGKLPIFAVARDTGALLQQAAREGWRVTLSLRSRYGLGRSANVVGEIPGRRRGYLQLAAHYDAWYAGAADNAAGLAILLALARHWHGRQAPLTLRFVSFAAEEEGLMGSLFDVLTRAPVVKALCRGVLSPDIVGPCTPGLYISGGPAAARAQAVALACRSGYRGAAVHDFADTTFGDHWPYTLLGIPGLMFSKMPYPLYHTPADTPEKLDYDDLRWTAAIVGEVADRAIAGR